ncbi:deoxyribonuclease NucA/NucB [Micromonospora sp. Llam0]|uniref:NucA/NucB deoxyribonuclease domain-containing protein n=1 Tax=Micromonospora sp. Llam0 TaxID=2485143 RepID=UPI000F469C3F|nr:hypothetical protein [Micromonospora sp. Llam0]ROO52866.1 deoxyribonuclease NucA/NucB [Micromonospora sp. Llam0]
MPVRGNRLKGVVIGAVTLLGVTLVSGPAVAEDGAAPTAEQRRTALLDSVSAQPQPVRGPAQETTSLNSRGVERTIGQQAAKQSCGPAVNGAQTCVTIGAATKATPGRLHRNGTLAPIPFPTWCTSSSTLGTRTQACYYFGVTVTSRQTVNGQTTITGQAFLDGFSLSYTSTSIETFGHQLGLVMWDGWGAATSAVVSGFADGGGPCSMDSSSFPAQPLLPMDSWKVGESFFTMSSTASGIVAYCDSDWDLVFSIPGHSSGSVDDIAMDDVRCDNATGANGSRPARPGCVIYWYASQITYSQSQYPSLAAHVSLAQGSGLPGNSFNAPLVRTTNQATITANRNLACGDAPSIAGRSCDEYPLASTQQGLAAGGSRRSFTGCNINAPQATGPTGASACMITASENNAQGGLHARFYYDWRILHGDPFLVLVGA